MTTSYRSRLGTAPEEGMKSPCVASTTGDITLSGEQTIDGKAVVDGNRVLVRSQTDATENGIYDASTGAWSRSTDWNANDDVINGQIVPDANSLIQYQVSFSGTFNIDTTSVAFSGWFGDTNYFGAAGGAADVMTVILATTLTAYTDGVEMGVRAIGANTVTTPTIAPDGLAAKTIVKHGNQALLVGDIPRADYEMILRYNLANDNVELLNPSLERITTNATNIANHIADTDDAHDASAISNTPAGAIAATDVQGAINELDGDKAKLAGDSGQDFSAKNISIGSALKSWGADFKVSGISNAKVEYVNTVTKETGTAHWCYHNGTNWVYVDSVNDARRCYVLAGEKYEPYAASGVADATITWDDFHHNEGWIAPTLLNSWVNYGTPFDDVLYKKDADGSVTIKGLVRFGTLNTTVFTLPAGYRPAKTLLIDQHENNAYGQIAITNAGLVSQDTGISTLSLSLNHTFKADQ